MQVKMQTYLVNVNGVTDEFTKAVKKITAPCLAGRLGS